MDQLEGTLRRLFDAQKFFREPRLEKLIGTAFAEELDDDELSVLAAAGDPFAKPVKPDDGK
jgi:orotate phosphoribosyltransferase